MNDIIQILESCSLFVVFRLLGDPVKKDFAQLWGEPTPIPNAYSRKYGKIVCNIWDTAFLPVENIDYVIIVTNNSITLKESLKKLKTGNTQVIFTGDTKDNEYKLINHHCLLYGYSLVCASEPKECKDLIDKLSNKVYQSRLIAVENQIKGVLAKGALFSGISL